MKKAEPSGEAAASRPKGPYRSRSSTMAFTCWELGTPSSTSQTLRLTLSVAKEANSRAMVDTPSPGVAAANAITRPRPEMDGPSDAHNCAISDARSTIRRIAAFPTVEPNALCESWKSKAD